MANVAQSAHGTLLKMGDGASVEVFTTIPGITSISLPDVKLDFEDITSHDSAASTREYMPSFRESDNVNVEMLHNITNTVHKSLRAANQNATLKNFQLIFPDGSVAKFSAYVAGFGGSAPYGQVLRGSMTLRVSGQVVWSVT